MMFLLHVEIWKPASEHFHVLDLVATSYFNSFGQLANIFHKLCFINCPLIYLFQ